MKNKQFYSSLGFGLLISSCQMGVPYEPPMIDVPCEWHSPLSESIQPTSVDKGLWWESLNDPILNCLLERAALQNIDLQIAITRILESRRELKGEKGHIYPRLDGSAMYGHAQFDKNTVNQLLGTVSKHASHNRRNIDFFELGFDASWEMDLFGMYAHQQNALEAKAEATEEEFNNLWVSLSAEVVKNYVDLRGFQERLALVEKNIEAQKETIQLTDSLLETGFTTTIDRRNADEQLNILGAEKPQLELAIYKTIHRLSILLGYAPGALFSELSQPKALPILPSQNSIGIPSELLRRRPDIRKAERELAAATENVEVAIAALFPRISLKGFVGDIGAFCSGGSFTWFGGPQLLLPIFNSTLLEQDIDLSEIKVQQALFEYQKTVLEALEETENAIASYHFELERNQYLEKALNSSQEAYELSHQLYQKGLKNYLEVLQTNRSYLANQEAYVQSQIELLFHYISLYKALGGGFCCP